MRKTKKAFYSAAASSDKQASIIFLFHGQGKIESVLMLPFHFVMSQESISPFHYAINKIKD